jgi:hypothetical protein
MRTCVYRAGNALDAHLIKNVLAQQDIEAYIEGEYLQGGVGDLQAIDLIRVVVDDSDKTQAKQIVADWEATPIDETPEIGVRRISQIGLLISGTALVLLFLGMLL